MKRACLFRTMHRIFPRGSALRSNHHHQAPRRIADLRVVVPRQRPRHQPTGRGDQIAPPPSYADGIPPAMTRPAILVVVCSRHLNPPVHSCLLPTHGLGPARPNSRPDSRRNRRKNSRSSSAPETVMGVQVDGLRAQHPRLSHTEWRQSTRLLQRLRLAMAGPCLCGFTTPIARGNRGTIRLTMMKSACDRAWQVVSHSRA